MKTSKSLSEIYCAALLALLPILSFGADSAYLGAPVSETGSAEMSVASPVQGESTELAQIDQRLMDHPRDVQAKFKRAASLAQLGHDNEAMDAFQALIQQYPELPEPYNNLAALYAKRGDYEQARALLEMAIKAHPSYELAYRNLGALYLRLAAVAYQRAASLNPRDQLAIERQQQIQALLNQSTHVKP